jgi:inner membrane protein
MSSFIGHALPALSLYFAPQNRCERIGFKDGWLWLAGLVLVAWAPDIDHVMPALNASAHQGMRITHSIAAASIVPLGTILMLWRLGTPRQKLPQRSLQLVLAGFSHLVLDMLTGSMALPLLYPLSNQVFQLRVGILPSAGSLRLTNYYLYRNLFIEMGVLLPLLASLHLFARPMQNTARHKGVTVLLLLCTLGFMAWAASLSR